MSEDIYAGDFIDGIKKLRSQGMTLVYLASQFGIQPKSLTRYLNWGRFPKWLLDKYANMKDRLEAEASDAEIVDLRDFITRLAHYLAANERVNVNWRFPFQEFPQPDKKHLDEAESIGRAGSLPSLALALLNIDFNIKRLASYKMFHSRYRIRDFSIPNWPGLWGWLDLWGEALATSKAGRRFIFKYARLTWRWKHHNAEVTDDRSEVFARIDKLNGEYGANTSNKVPDWYVQRKSDKILEALKSGRRQDAGIRLDYNTKNKTR